MSATLQQRLRRLVSDDDPTVGDEAADEIDRLRSELRYQEDRDGCVSTHGPTCYGYGQRHYGCALAEIERLRGIVRRLPE